MKILLNYLTCQMLILIFVYISPLLAHPTTSTERTINAELSDDEKCLTKNVEYLRTTCTYTNKTHPCFTGTILYRQKPIHLLNMEGVAAHLCSHGTQIEAAASYCCFTPKCLKLCYEQVSYESVVPAH